MLPRAPVPVCGRLFGRSCTPEHDTSNRAQGGHGAYGRWPDPTDAKDRQSATSPTTCPARRSTAGAAPHVVTAISVPNGSMSGTSPLRTGGGWAASARRRRYTPPRCNGAGSLAAGARLAQGPGDATPGPLLRRRRIEEQVERAHTPQSCFPALGEGGVVRQPSDLRRFAGRRLSRKAMIVLTGIFCTGTTHDREPSNDLWCLHLLFSATFGRTRVGLLGDHSGAASVQKRGRR